MTPQEAIERLRKIPVRPKPDNALDMLAIIMAVKALEKQIPKKCKKFRDICDCGHSVFPHMRYCDICGQALDWDG